MKIKSSALRRSMQIVSFFLLVYIVWNTAFPLNNFFNPAFYFYIDPFAMFITGIAERVLLFGMIFSAAMIIFTVIFGRFFCGWICPLGGAIDFMSWITIPLTKKIGTFYSTGRLSPMIYVKYAILAIVFAAALFGYQAAWIFDPITIFVRTFSLNIHPGINSGLERVFEIVQPESQFSSAVYSFFQEHILVPDLHEFSHSRIFLYLFTAILIITILRRRFWCRYVCPLGAVFAAPSKGSILERRIGECAGGCSTCIKICRMNAIKEDRSYDKGECILCLDCTEGCPRGNAEFLFNKNILPNKFLGINPPKGNDHRAEPGTPFGLTMTRRSFAGALAAAAAAGMNFTALASSPRINKGLPLRPPGALKGNEFVQRCIRCGNCMKVCPTGVIRPAPFEFGIGSLWSPYLDPIAGYCEHLCSLCGVVCPTGAIIEMSVKKKGEFKIGLAVINKETCLPWAKNENCIVCEEHCPIPDKAIKLEKKRVRGAVIKYPVVDAGLCIGCAICENKCPVNPVRGINTYSVE